MQMSETPKRLAEFHILCQTSIVCKFLHHSICAVISGLCTDRASKFMFALAQKCLKLALLPLNWGGGERKKTWPPCCCITFYKKLHWQKLHIFPGSYHTPFQKPQVRVTTVVLTSQVYVPAILLLLILQKFTIMLLSSIKWHNADTKFYENRSGKRFKNWKGSYTDSQT